MKRGGEYGSAERSVQPALPGRTGSRLSADWMSKYVGFLILALVALIGAAGCLSTAFQEVTYDGGALQISVENVDKPVENAVLQVTIMEVGALEQHEVFSEARYINLDREQNKYTVQVDLQPGSYKLFLTIFVDDERRTSIIRDLEVAP